VRILFKGTGLVRMWTLRSATYLKVAECAVRSRRTVEPGMSQPSRVNSVSGADMLASKHAMLNDMSPWTVPSRIVTDVALGSCVSNALSSA
jgi:hypothetical protein